jgi:glycerol-3-phosphate dehydrogenase subunit B
MKSDVIVIGAELDGLLAALHLAKAGANVRLLMPGGGTLHNWPGGLGVLGSPSPVQSETSPFMDLSKLDALHPYRLIEASRIESAVCSFLDWLKGQGQEWKCPGRNVEVLTAAGRGTAAFAGPRSLATFEMLPASGTAIIAFEDHIDFVPELCARGLSSRGIEAMLVRVLPPASGDSLRIARALDACDPGYFQTLRPLFRDSVQMVLFPAVLGLSRHKAVLAFAESKLGVPVAEIATLPPSLFGLRLQRLLLAALSTAGVALHPDVRGLRAEVAEGNCERLTDARGQAYSADKYVASNGGILTGGLEIDSRGVISEPIFGVDVHQTFPLAAKAPHEAIDALHRSGAKVDETLRPSRNGRALRNVHATGTLLAHWNPLEEVSGEGVSIATGRAAADFAARGAMA